jgi:hypothetical protein
MKRTKIATLLRTWAVALLPLLAASCSDDFAVGGGYEDGKPATTTVKVVVPNMDIKTRAFVDEIGANLCQDLWVGVYHKSDGKRDFCTYEDISTNLEEIENGYAVTQLTLSDVRSGENYIVAVANSAYHNGIAEPGSTSDAQGLKELLDAADTWDDFLKVTTTRDASDISVFTYDLLMAGYYSESSAAASSEDIPTVSIAPGISRLSGSIFLRRNISYNLFTVAAGNNVKVTPKTWRVRYIPAKSYVMEHATGERHNNATLTAADFGVSAIQHAFSVADGVTNADGTAAKSFEFYLMENKHDAVSGAIPDTEPTEGWYQLREREYKNQTTKANTGVYQSLVANYTDGDDIDHNNYATIVEFTADVEYYIDAKADPATAEPLDYDNPPADAILRTAEATYTIHLGYCDNKEDNGVAGAATAADFNCRRNSRYTYKVRIDGVNKLVVEATRQEEEPQPGAEGNVIDAANSTQDLDAHYCVFNIALSDAERKAMGWRLTAPFNGTTYQYSSAEVDKNTLSLDDLDKNVLYKWIEFKPTTGPGVLAVYKTSPDDESRWTLDNMRHPETYANPNAEDANGRKWYTVFVDEYVYHEGPYGTEYASLKDDGNTESLWYTYANQGNRTVELLADAMHISSDGETTYTKATYAFSQRSIQTFYANASVQTSELGLGIEHLNETYGLNMRFDTSTRHKSNAARWNTWYYASGFTQSDDAADWNTRVDFTRPDTVLAYTYPADGSFGDQQIQLLSHSQKIHPVPQLKVYDKATVNAAIGENFPWDPTPTDSRVFYVNGACLNRNRDLDGDGKISGDEVRWYLPTYNTYALITIGENALTTPLIDFNAYPRTLYYKQNNGNNSTSGRWNFHFGTSDNKALWAEEGMSDSSSPYSQSGSAGYGGAYEIRCVRVLGGDPTASIPDEDKTNYTKPYQRDGNVITNLYFDDACIRPNVSSYLPPNALNSQAGRLPHSFEIARQDMCADVDTLQDGYGIFNFGHNGSNKGYLWSNAGVQGTTKNVTEQLYRSAVVNSLCRHYSQDSDGKDKGKWRLPNYKEFCLLYMEGILGGYTARPSCSHDYFSSWEDQNGKYRFYGTTIWSPYLNRGISEVPQGVTNKTWNIRVRCVRDK